MFSYIATYLLFNIGYIPVKSMSLRHVSKEFSPSECAVYCMSCWKYRILFTAYCS